MPFVVPIPACPLWRTPVGFHPNECLFPPTAVRSGFREISSGCRQFSSWKTITLLQKKKMQQDDVIKNKVENKWRYNIIYIIMWGRRLLIGRNSFFFFFSHSGKSRSVMSMFARSEFYSKRQKTPQGRNWELFSFCLFFFLEICPLNQLFPMRYFKMLGKISW